MLIENDFYFYFYFEVFYNEKLFNDNIKIKEVMYVYKFVNR